jgi:hypothetical protein
MIVTILGWSGLLTTRYQMKRPGAIPFLLQQLIGGFFLFAANGNNQQVSHGAGTA